MTFPDLIAMLCSRNRWTPFFGYIQKPAVLLPAMGVVTSPVARFDFSDARTRAQVGAAATECLARAWR